MADPNDHKPGEPSHIHLGPDKKGAWWPWLLLALALLALLLLLTRSCSSRDSTPVAAPGNEIDAAQPAAGSLALPGGRVLAVTPGSMNEQLGTWLAGTEAAPRTFQFDTLNFDTGKSEIRADDRKTLDDLSQILIAYPKTSARIVGYADSRGSDPANEKLGKARAESVKAALVSKKIDANRIQTASGGESEPVATNATPGGRLENRRTEFVVTSR